MTSDLDLYAELEDLIGFENEALALYEHYIVELQRLGIREFLDIGCGSGKLMRLASQVGMEPFGIDLSETMVQRTLAAGGDARCVDVCALGQTFPAATAVFDVLNYLEPNALEGFFRCVGDVLEPGGYFLADINTQYGFEEIAQGTLMMENPERFAAMESVYEEKRMETKLRLFKKEGEGYRRYAGTIVQHYHPLSWFERQAPMRLVKNLPVTLFGDQPDKRLLLFQKR